MASIITGFDYDIFISYRQKDNKYDGWVTEFVSNLKKELEAAFKEDISVYFDMNPYDGLLETHNVGASLKDKLKCLVFIPVISRTYCDPKSFAWEYEFKAFTELASEDQFGLNVKLSKGNVGSRVLPIVIHELDAIDTGLCKSVLGGPLRGIEFIYKEPGVNRPLRHDDDVLKNLNNTKYRNQINKVANAIREIISGLKADREANAEAKVPFSEGYKKEGKKEKISIRENPVKLNRLKLLSGFLIAAVLIISGILAYSKIFRRDTLKSLRSAEGRISVAVMPFHNLTNDTIMNVWQVGIQDILITSLSNSEELKVRQIESISGLIQSKGLMDYASITPTVAGKISQKLNADIFIYGSIKQSSAIIRLNAQLIDSKTTETFKSFQIDGPADKILQIIDSLSVMVKNFLVISKLGKEVTPDYKHLISTGNPEAYRDFIYGKNAFMKRDYSTASNLLTQAIALDSNFTFAVIMLSFAQADLGLYDNAKKLCLRIYGKRDQMTMQQKIYTNWAYSANFGTPDEEIKYVRQFLEIDDEQPLFYFVLGESYYKLAQYDKAVPEYEKALEIYSDMGSKPMWVFNYTKLGYVYHVTGQYNKEKELYRKADQDFPGDQELLIRHAILSLSTGDSVSANEFIMKFRSVAKGNSISDADISTSLGEIYEQAGILNKAEEYFRQALSLEPENAAKLNRLAWFLINDDRNIDEGLDLADKALHLAPDDYRYIDTKGWGLYKKGKYKEALVLFNKCRELKPYYDHGVDLHIEAAKKAVAGRV
jgi:tetratricopeptide (TPR) repeat protein